MVEIRIKQPKQFLADLGFTNICFDLDTSIKIEEEANIKEFLLAVIKAMQIEGYKVTETAMKQAIEELIEEDEIERSWLKWI